MTNAYFTTIQLQDAGCAFLTNGWQHAFKGEHQVLHQAEPSFNMVGCHVLKRPDGQILTFIALWWQYYESN